MKRAAPAFWQANQGRCLSNLLMPFSWVARCIFALRLYVTKPMDVGVPVFCCGNLSVGGTGKTIVARDLAARLQAMGHKPHILSRGYKGRLKGPLRVDPTRMTAADTGDEPMMMARHAPVWIGADRRLTAISAREAGADCLIMDDGLQNPGLLKTRKFIVIDGTAGLGNRRVLPAGPLREPWEKGLQRADALIVIGEDATGVAIDFPDDKPVWRAQLQPHPELSALGVDIVAFAGIGRPSKFFAMLRHAGLKLVREIPFPDHHMYSPRDCERLLAIVENEGRHLVTTEKDAVKLPEPLRSKVHVTRVCLQWETPSAIDENLASAWDNCA